MKKRFMACILACFMLLSVMPISSAFADGGAEAGSAVGTVIAGDADGDGSVTKDDAIYVLMHTFFKEEYSANQDFDFDGDGNVTKDDAIYVLMHTFFPEEYPMPDTEAEPPFTAPVDSIAFFDPSAITEDISGITGNQKAVTITGSTGIASLAAHSQSGATGVQVSLVNDKRLSDLPIPPLRERSTSFILTLIPQFLLVKDSFSSP